MAVTKITEYTQIEIIACANCNGALAACLISHSMPEDWTEQTVIAQNKGRIIKTQKAILGVTTCKCGVVSVSKLFKTKAR